MQRLAEFQATQHSPNLITVPDFLTATPIWKIGHWQLRPSRTHAEYLTADDAGQMDPCMEDR